MAHERAAGARDGLVGALYRRLLRPLLFRLDAERAHDLTIMAGRLLGSNPLTRGAVGLALGYGHPMLRTRALGLEFPNPVGLGAGLDKGARLARLLPRVGFGFVEVGSVTAEPCPGNPRPRLWRVTEARSIAVNLGLNSEGCERVARRLAGLPRPVPVGVSVAKTNSERTVDVEAGVRDYLKAFRALSGLADYVTLNVSCPNSFGGQPFGDPGRLDRLLAALDVPSSRVPVLLKLSPDLAPGAVDEVVGVALRRGVAGLVCSNLTEDRSMLPERLRPPAGGLGGAAVAELADRQLRRARSAAGDGLVLVGCGGVSSAEDAYRKLRLGASLVQLVSGLVFEGPQLVGEVNRGLVTLLERDGFGSVAEAVGADVA